MMTDISAYLDFVLALFFAFGVAFQVPVATILLVAIGVATPESLVAKRPYVIVGAFVVGMVLTPPDVFSQTMLAIPMWMLFELGVLFARVLVRERAAREAAESGPVGHALARVPAGGGGRPGGGPGPERGGSGKTGTEVGRDIDAGAIDEPGRWRPLTEEEMETELDLLEADELAARSAETQAVQAAGPADPVEEKIQRANRLRELDNAFAARKVLYEVLEEGDESQRRVARNILNQLDEG
jgi:sec-independent protein translocase protein TatC